MSLSVWRLLGSVGLSVSVREFACVCGCVSELSLRICTCQDHAGPHPDLAWAHGEVELPDCSI